MKTIYKLFILAFISTGALFYSCETVELELLASPNALAEDQADPDLLLNSIQRAYVTSAGVLNDRSSELTRIDYMFGRDYFNNYGPGTMDGSWTRAYSNIFTNTASLEALNEASDVPLTFQLGVAKTLQAHTLQLLVDFLGDIPWTEALNPIEFPNPNVDDDATVYAVADALLEEALVLLAGGDAPSSVTDFFYGGDSASWIRLVNTLKIRSALTKGDTATFNALINAGNFISNTSHDFQFSYGTQLLNPNTQHPDYFADYTTSGANIYQSIGLMFAMQGADKADGSDDDPRIRYYFFRQTDCTPGASCNTAGDGQFLQCSLQTPPVHLGGYPFCFLEDGYWGRLHGNDEGTPPDNFLRTAVGVYPAGGLFDDSRFDGLNQGVGGNGAGIEPILLASYVDFWRAEVALSAGQVGNAANFVEAGMTKSIAKVQTFGALDGSRDASFEPTATYVSDYIDNIVAQITDTSDDTWDVLAEQFFIAMYGGGQDAWNFYRRTGYPTNAAPSLEPNPGVFPRTFLYPNVEVIANPNILQRTDNATQVFWDTNPAGPAFPPAN